MKKAVTLAAIAGLSLASDIQDAELMARLPSKPTVHGGSGNKIFFDDDELYGESRSKLSIFTKKKGETNERTENDDELMNLVEYLTSQPQLVSVPERQILDVRTTVPVISVLPAEQPKTKEDNKPKQRSNFSIFVRKEGEKTDEENHHGKSATRSNFSILNRRHVSSQDVQHAKKDLEDLVSELLRHKYVKSDNELFGLRDLKKGGDKDSNKANVLKLDSEEDNELYGMRDWRRERERDSGKAGVLGFDSEEDNELYGMRDWKRERDSGKAGVLGLDDEGDNEFRVLGSLIHDGLEIYRDVKNKDYGNVVNHGIKAARDVHELTRKRNFLGN